ncbi:MAG: hypothetical protein ACE5ID_03125 [Acidobacteriota bacterium]
MESKVETPVEDPKDEILVHLTHNYLLATLREIGQELMGQLLNAPGVQQPVVAADVPLQVDMRQFCRLMAPRLSMN